MATKLDKYRIDKGFGVVILFFLLATRWLLDYDFKNEIVAR
jgi:hypothetical protein